MNEQNVEEILIDGSEEIFGGRIYGATFRNNLGNSPSILTVNIANESGSYLKPNLSIENFNEPFEVKLGDVFTGNFYLVRTRLNIDSTGKVLELTFWDGSFYLDKIYIGLNKKHGIIPVDPNANDLRDNFGGIRESKNSRLNKFYKGSEDIVPYYIQRDENDDITPLIIIGREFHPCDTDRDGFINLEEDVFKIDGCDPCPDCPEEKYSPVLERQKCLDLECSEIFEVKYNFRSLIEAIKEFFELSQIDIEVDESTLPIVNGEYINDKYFTDYEGTLREVLQRWSADFAVNFYIEYDGDQKLKLKFLDTKTDIDIIGLDDIKNNNIIGYDEEESIENTENKGSISLYRQQGERKTYQCRQNIKLNLRPVVLPDLFSDAGDAILGKDQTGSESNLSFEDLEISMALGKYSVGMRDHFWWGKMYGADEGREDITNLMYLGPPDTNRRTVGSEGGLTFTVGNQDVDISIKAVSIPKSDGISQSDGIDSVDISANQKRAKDRGIPELGDLKPLAFFFPTSRNGGASEIYYNKGTVFGSEEGKVEDHSSKILNQIKEFWNPSDEELEFFSNTPLFGSDAFDIDNGNVTVAGFSRGYFMLASRKEDLYEKILSNENRLASDFIGKFFAKQIDVDDKLNMCFMDRDGKRDFNESQISIEGGGQFYHFEDENTKKFLEDELFSFGHSEGSKIGSLQTKIRDKKVKVVDSDGNRIFDEGIVVQKVSNVWFPSEIRTNEIRHLIDIYENKKFKIIGSVEDDEEIANMVANYAPEHVNDPDVKLFVVYPDDFSKGLRISRDVEHPISMGVNINRNVKKEFGCYGNCENNEECFKGETDPARIQRLTSEYNSLFDKNSELARAIERELQGDICDNGKCVPVNGCKDNIDCGRVLTIGNSRFSEFECINGNCVEKLGLQSPLCTRINVNGFQIFAPPHGFDTPSNFIIVDDGFDAKSYGVILQYQKNEEVFIPKVEHIIQENIERFEKGYAKFNVNLYQIPLDDLRIFKEDVCEPDESLLEELHEEFNRDLTFNIDTPRKTLNVSIAGISIDSGKKLNVENGLESFSVRFSSDGVVSEYTFSNKIAQPISIDLNKRIVDILKKRERKYQGFRDFNKMSKTVSS